MPCLLHITYTHSRPVTIVELWHLGDEFVRSVPLMCNRRGDKKTLLLSDSKTSLVSPRNRIESNQIV